MKNILWLFFVIFNLSSLLAEDDLFKDILPNKNLMYIIKLDNGDILSGYVVEMVNHPEEGEGIKFSTEIGTATIYASQIKIIKPFYDYYKHNHRVFLMPTAEPIGDDHFIGNFELLLFYGGVGIYDLVSITAGRSVIPTIRSDQQLSVINAKVTLFEMPLASPARKLSLAIGTNYAWANHDNRLVHYYGVGTFSMNRSAFSAMIFTKAGSNDYNTINMGGNKINLNYADGSFGMAIGIDTRFSSIHDLHFIGELWNSDVSKPTNSAVMLGLRLCSSNFSADFGLSFFTQPFVAPFCSFVWTPFD